jgi:hypothetical protein
MVKLQNYNIFHRRLRRGNPLKIIQKKNNFFLFFGIHSILHIRICVMVSLFILFSFLVFPKNSTFLFLKSKARVQKTHLFLFRKFCDKKEWEDRKELYYKEYKNEIFCFSDLFSFFYSYIYSHQKEILDIALCPMYHSIYLN